MADSLNLTDPIFHDDEAARAHLESIRWPDGPVCPHCGNTDAERIVRLQGKSHRPGLYQCNECREHFTVTVGSVMERSHIPLAKWVLGFHLMAASKKGVSAHQLMRTLGLGSYRTAWFMAHRIREAMKIDGKAGPLGGEGKTVEADETLIGGKERNKRKSKRNPKNIGAVGKQVVFSLVERDGAVRSFHVANVTAKTLRPIMVKHASRQSSLMTDEAGMYRLIGPEYWSHEKVNHGADEYVRGSAHTNTAEGYFSIMKRGINGVYHHVSEAHLSRYLAEFDFRYSNRAKLGVSDTERATRAIRGAEGKRLMYQQPDETA